MSQVRTSVLIALGFSALTVISSIVTYTDYQSRRLKEAEEKGKQEASRQSGSSTFTNATSSASLSPSAPTETPNKEYVGRPLVDTMKEFAPAATVLGSIATAGILITSAGWLDSVWGAVGLSATAPLVAQPQTQAVQAQSPAVSAPAQP